MRQLKLFDRVEAELRRQQGMERAARAKKAELDLARQIAIRIATARDDRSCHADLVQKELIEIGINLGNAAGSIFTRDQWEFTGQFIKSRRVIRHSNLVRVWRLKELVSEAG